MTPVVVVGGGVIGLSLALELRAAGADVEVLDRSPHGQQASVSAGGLLAPQLECRAPGPFLDLCLRSRAMYPRWAQALEAASDLEVGYLESGLVHAAFSDVELHAAEAWGAWQRAVGLRAELLDTARARSLAPALSPRLLGALYLPDDHQVDPRLLMPALLEACRRAGVRLRLAEVHAVASRSGQVVGVDVTGGRIASERVVLTAGPWSGLVEGAPVGPALSAPVRGQLLELKPSTPIGSKVLGGARGYLIPRADGRVIVGSTKEHQGFDARTTPEGQAQLHALAVELCPALEGAQVLGQWAALRPCSPDEAPVLGEGPLEGLWLATGHYRNGILLAPATARLMSDAVLNRTQPPALRHFRYQRLSP